MAGNKDEEVEALEALRDKSAELVRYLDNINEKLMQMNQQNEMSLRVLENWSSVIAISKCLKILLPNAVLVIIVIASWCICESRDPSKPMRHVAALLLCVLGGNATPAVADLEKVVKSFGGEFDQEQAEKLVKELEGKNIEEVIEAGKAKLATVSVGAAPAAGAAAGGAAPAKEEEKAVEEEEEVDMGGGMDMFGGDEDY
ncbi:60S acidic ribosomal protein P2 [Phytophthora nicotianae]|nr:60S acidic ribosomal protein P2 [Phytophthora nicotianae]